MIGEETTLPEDDGDVFTRLDLSERELLAFLEEGFATTNPVLSSRLDLHFMLGEVTQHDNKDTYHFIYSSSVWEDPDIVRPFLEVVGDLLAAKLDYQIALSVILPEE